MTGLDYRPERSRVYELEIGKVETIQEKDLANAIYTFFRRPRPSKK
jgi:hypothetical protein